MNPHYFGPKLAHLLRSDPATERRLLRGEWMVGTLDSYLIWKLTGVHRTDPTMAARTLLYALDSGSWSDEMLARFNVRRDYLPEIWPSNAMACPMDDASMIVTSLADQAAAILAAAPMDPGICVTVVGTGTFVMRHLGQVPMLRPGYLTAPVHADVGVTCYALEATINCSVPDVAGAMPSRTPSGAYCMPERHGYGAPLWDPKGRLRFSRDDLTESVRAVTEFEGYLFRIRQVIEGLFGGSTPTEVVLVGGGSSHPELGAALTALLGCRVTRSPLSEASLWCVGRLAAGLPPHRAEPHEAAVASSHWSHLRSKYLQWHDWMVSL